MMPFSEKREKRTWLIMCGGGLGWLFDFLELVLAGISFVFLFLIFICILVIKGCLEFLLTFCKYSKQTKLTVAKLLIFTQRLFVVHWLYPLVSRCDRETCFYLSIYLSIVL